MNVDDPRLALAERRSAELAADLLLARHAAPRDGVFVDDRDGGGLPADADDAVFIAYCFKWLLGRDPDDAGLAHFQAKLRRGAARMDVIHEIVGGSEFRTKLGFGRSFRIERGTISNLRLRLARWLAG